MTRGVRRLGVLLLAVIVPTAVTLIWLGLRLLEQDRALGAQRTAERREQEAERAIRFLHERLDASLDEPVPYSVRFRLDSRSITPDDRGRILWVPTPPLSG